MKAFWRGELPLSRAFWKFAILYVALANICATGAAFAALAADLPIVVVVIIFLLPLPYVIVAVVGVWRSAETYKGPPHWAALARYATVVWGAIMIII